MQELVAFFRNTELKTGVHYGRVVYLHIHMYVYVAKEMKEQDGKGRIKINKNVK